jgi:hypothetical protein
LTAPVHLCPGNFRVAAGSRYQVGCQTFLVIEKDFEQVLGLEMLVSAEDCAARTNPRALSV